MDIIKIYCDGACSGNPGAGGWGAVLIWKNEIKEIEVYTDSKYLCDGITLWIKNWKKNGWKSGSNKIKNIDIWQELDDVASQLDVRWHWVKGHNGDYYNEMADSLAREAIKSMKI